ncbi:MAG TPA: MgtC/SapB family protein [Candidatus Gastranaerophilaceae bacterium]|nr:MgtC/SapB family protein [Candidatus Gastranaerophilaceae bacterium]HPT42033.1 MgtC/SapB family protein [Candidatus Gastranaerophilaceae bacterium]
MYDLGFELLIFIRIAAAILFGFGIGLERELTNKYAGLRTHILVCLGSCVFTILSIYAFPMAVDSTNPQAFGDPARIAAQILTGIGFIGGGTVLRHGSSVYGLTTAATLWISASIGMACGAGFLDIAFMATVFSILVLVLIRTFEKNVLVNSAKNFKRIKVIINCKEENSQQVHNYIIENFSNMHEISKKHDNSAEKSVKIEAIIDIQNNKTIQSIYKSFEALNGLESVSIQETND